MASVLAEASLRGTWCSGITSAPHAEGPGLKSLCVHCTVAEQLLGSRRRPVQFPVSSWCVRMSFDASFSVSITREQNSRSHARGVI